MVAERKVHVSFFISGQVFYAFISLSYAFDVSKICILYYVSIIASMAKQFFFGQFFEIKMQKLHKKGKIIFPMSNFSKYNKKHRMMNDRMKIKHWKVSK